MDAEGSLRSAPSDVRLTSPEDGLELWAGAIDFTPDGHPVSHQINDAPSTQGASNAEVIIPLELGRAGLWITINTAPIANYANLIAQAAGIQVGVCFDWVDRPPSDIARIW